MTTTSTTLQPPAIATPQNSQGAVPHRIVLPPVTQRGNRPGPPPLQLVQRRRNEASAVPETSARARIATGPSPATVAPSNGPLHQQQQPPNPQYHAAPVSNTAGPSRRQGKPIFDWISRKLGARRGSDAEHTREPMLAPSPRIPQHAPTPRNQTHNRDGQAVHPSDIFGPTRSSMDSSMLQRTESVSLRSYSVSHAPSDSMRRREANNPYPSLPIPLVRRSYPASTLDSDSRPPSLSSMSSFQRPRISIADDSSATDSFGLAGRVADEDASVRPLAPSPTSMSFISHSSVRGMPHNGLMRTESAPLASPPPRIQHRDTHSSSFTSDDGSRRPSLASTKPTTVISIDSAPPGHIAVAPSTSAHGLSQTVSNPSPISANVAMHHGIPSPVSPMSATSTGTSANGPLDDMRVPRHSRPHPRNNPHPASPPGPDASTQTLASSTFGLVSSPAIDRVERAERGGPRPPSIRVRDIPTSYHPPYITTSPSVAFMDRPGSLNDGLSTHAISLSGARSRYGRADDDASMRAVRRRGSWESGESRWSWRPGTENVNVFSALGRRGEYDASGDHHDGPASGNRSSVYTRDSYRTALTAWEGDDGELSTLASETALSTHRPVSVRV